ncbi:MAG: YbfB/YjiJ family MFS transporter [Rubrivivax sp.]|nr:YbfB/YjiJ family MFS transporter [Rubrivivax sp.]
MQSRAPGPLAAAAVGCAGLAAAMGIGRFAFTPLLPLMQAEQGLALSHGAWLAAANYLGYLAGALASLLFAPPPRLAARAGLAAVAVTTLAMAGASSLGAWLLLRGAAGAASAWVLIGASGWALTHLVAHGQGGRLGGHVFAGVGSGIVVAGLVCLLLSVQVAPGQVARTGWLVLGAMAAAVAALTWPCWGRVPAAAAAVSPSPVAQAPLRLDASAWVLVAAYGLLGLGYIVPATFLPAAARALVADPSVFGWAWPVFGAAAAVSTVLVARVAPQAAPRRVAAAGEAVMAVGVILPLLHFSLATLVLSALAVGGTFMVVTMAGLQEARRLAASSHAAPTRLMSAMTAAFALGQLAGPLLVARDATPRQALLAPSAAAAGLLALAALALWRTSR